MSGGRSHHVHQSELKPELISLVPECQYLALKNKISNSIGQLVGVY